MRGEDVSYNSVTPIPSQRRLTHQILKHWKPFQVLEQTLAVSSRAEQFRLRRPRRVVGTAVDSVLPTEMGSLEPQEEDSPKRVLWYKPMSRLCVIPPHRRDES